MEYRDEIWQQILDGKRSWTAAEDAEGDADVFLTRILNPLRQLRAMGKIDNLEEIRINVYGESNIGIVEIIGAIDFGS